MDKNLIIDILTKAKFSAKLIHYIQNHFEQNVNMILPSPYDEDHLENPLLHLNATERMTKSIAQLIHLKGIYLAKNIPISHLYKSIYDLSYRIERYYKRHGVYGLSDSDIRWLTPLYQAEIFDIGVLRFQISHFSYEEIERSGHEYMLLPETWKDIFLENTPIITIHILKNANLKPEKVTASFEQAVRFFDYYFPEHDYDIFVCRTWLLYEPIQELLGEASNIVDFARRFEIIAKNKNTKQALARIYGTSDLNDISQMEKTSSLQKTAYKNLNKVGEAAGIIYKASI